MKRIKTNLTHLLSGRLLPRYNESGQSLIILTFAFLGLIAMLGLALDLGMVYIERVRVKRTVDAAALAAVFELPVEEAAVTKAMALIDSNGYNLEDINVYVAGCVQDLHDRDNDNIRDEMINLPTGDINNILVNASDVLTPTTADTMFYLYNRAIALPDAPNFFIDTRSFQTRDELDGLCSAGERISGTASDYGSANKIRISANLPVRMNFMQFFGFGAVPVPDSAIAENASSLDVALVLDSTGSMEYDTICYGCWERCDDSVVTECASTDIYKPYPTNGRAYPFPYPPNPPGGSITARQQRMLSLIVGSDGDDSVWPPVAGTPKPEGTNDYIILEAEFYSDNNSNWDPSLRPNGQGYWAIQRRVYDSSGGNDSGGALAIDGFGYEGTSDSLLDGLVRHHPMTENSDSSLPFGRRYTAADAVNDISPRLEYDFRPGSNWNSSVYVHFKGQYYDGSNNSLQGEPKDEFFWAIYDTAGNQVFPGSGVQSTRGGARNDHWDPRPSKEWSWFSANTNTVLNPTKTYTLRIWAGSGGYAFDRFIISTRSSVTSPTDLRRFSATPGTAQRLAADPCNPIFGLNVLQTSCNYITIFGPTNNLNNSLFDALNPMRGAQQAMHNFAARLDPKMDQVGFVDFDDDAGQRAQLECLRASRKRAEVSTDKSTYPYNTANGYADYDETQCDDPTNVSAAGRVPISYTLVFQAIEDAYPPGGGTDVADGLRRGLHMLGITTDNDGEQQNNCEWRWNGSMWQIKNATNNVWTNQPAPNRSSNPTGHCARGAAGTPIIVLLTDGAPTNGNPGDNSDCTTWGSNNPLPYNSFPSTDNKYECIMYYADIAADKGVIVYTIGLGAGADPDLLKAVADTTRGQYYFAPSAAQLDQIFDQILANVYVRLLQ